MGCHTWYYEKLENITLQEIEDRAIFKVKDFIQSFTEEDLKNDFMIKMKEEQELLLEKMLNRKASLYEVIGFTNYTFIDGWLCKEIKDIEFLFRTFDYDDEPLHNLEDTITHIDKYYIQQKKVSFKIKRMFFLLGIKIKIWYYNKFKNTSLGYTHTHYSNGTIELNDSYENTIRKVKEFWNKYPNAVIQFG